MKSFKEFLKENRLIAEMRSEFLEVDTEKEAKKLAPWADKIIKVEGGYHAFESYQDYLTFMKQEEKSNSI